MDLIGELFVIVLDKLINKLAKKPDDGGSGSGNGRAVAATVTKGPQWYNKPYDNKMPPSQSGVVACSVALIIKDKDQ